MGANPVKDSAQKGLVLVASRNKVTTIEPINREENAKLFAALDSYPHHAFSPEGRRNVCRRFGISDEQLEATLLAYVRPGEYATEAERRAADLAHSLRAIEAVISPPKRKEAPKGKQKKGAAKC
jgi:hypothetical protein